MANEPIQGGPYPLQSERADGPGAIKAVVDWAAPKLNMTFATTGERDAQLTSPEDGMVCTIGSGSAAEMLVYVDGEWRPIMTKAVAGKRSSPVTGQEMPSATHTEIDPGSVNYLMGGVTASGNGLQAPVSGLYSLEGVVRTLTGSGEQIQGRLRVNGTSVFINQASDAIRYVSLATIYPLEAGDVVTMSCYPYASGGLAVSTSAGEPHLAIALIART